MTTSYPVAATPGGRGPREATPRIVPSTPPPATAGSWRYRASDGSRKSLIFAIIVSAGLHAGFIFGFGGAPKKVPPPQEAPLLALSLVMPELKELEEPEDFRDSDEPVQSEEMFAPVPMQADVPTMPQPSDFVQQMDFASLIEPPDLSKAKMLSIPESDRRGGKILDLGKIFNLADLDRVPEAVLQTPPVYPTTLRREGITATVVVEFIVTSNGQVLNVVAVDTTHFGFNEAAVRGVEKWKFRPGMRGGRKVNTRMRAPIVFRVIDAE